MCEKLIVLVREKTTVLLTEQQAKDVLVNGGLDVYGKRFDLTNDIAILANDYSRWFFTEVMSRREDHVKQFKKVILAGGGAHIVAPYMPRQIQNIWTPAEPEFDNARGFLKLLHAGQRTN